jgi:hypothetical protein
MPYCNLGMAIMTGHQHNYCLKVVEKQGESFNHGDDWKYGRKGNIIGPQLYELLWSSPIWVYQA